MGAPNSDLFAFAEAQRRRDAGMHLAASNSPAFSVLAYAAVVRVAGRQPFVHVDDVLAEDVPTPHHANCWGAVWMRAIRDGVIERTAETRPCTTDPRKHAHRYFVYRSLVWRR